MITKYPNQIVSVYDEVVLEQDSETLGMSYADPNVKHISLTRELNSEGIAQFSLQGILKNLFFDRKISRGIRSWEDKNLIASYMFLGDINPGRIYWAIRRIQQFGDEIEDIGVMQPHILTNTPLIIYPDYPLDVAVFNSDDYPGEPVGPSYSNDYSIAYN